MIKKGLFTRVKNSYFEGNNYIGNFAHVFSCTVGKMTYIGSRSNIVYSKIGSYCSISSNVSVIGGEHPSAKWVSTHPSFYKPANVCGRSYSDTIAFQEYKYTDEEKKYYVEIGCDVWIGANVLILNGVHIGDGAIIAAGAVVTKDVADYSIVGGVPAKEIRKRFNDEDIAFLRIYPYWLQPEEWLEKHVAEISDIDLYKKLFKS